LYGVFSIGFVVQERERHDKGAALIRPDERVKQLRFARKNGCDHLPFVPQLIACDHRYAFRSLKRFANSVSTENRPAPKIRIITDVKRKVYGSAT